MTQTTPERYAERQVEEAGEEPTADHAGRAAPPYTQAQVTRWLTGLARGMQRRGQTVFLIEHLQPGWLTTRRQHLLDLLVFSTVFGLCIGWINVTMWEMVLLLSPWDAPAALGSLWIWWLGSALWTFAVRALERLSLRWLAPSLRGRMGTAHLTVGARMGLNGLIWGALWIVMVMGWPGLTLGDVLVPLLQGAIVVIFYTARISLDKNLTVEALRWSWRTAAKGLLVGLGTGHVHWFLFFLGTTFFDPSGASKLLQNYLMFVPIHAACFFFFLGATIRLLPAETKTVPNQGVILSMHNAFKGALIGLVIGPFCWLVFRIALHDAALAVPLAEAALRGGLGFGLMVAMIGFLWFGGLQVISHATLRLALGATRQLPLRLADFLDYAAEKLHFLQQIGGGYMFIHRYLLEHFAALDAPKPAGRPDSGALFQASNPQPDPT